MDINLRTLDGFEFEEFCRELLKHSYDRVDITSKTGDGGKDLIAYKGSRVFIVECKHHPKRTISRPVVQKLHSAIVTSNTSYGIIMTTGRLSKGAIEYIEELCSKGIKIEYIELEALIDMGRKYGYNIFLDSETRTIRKINSINLDRDKLLLTQSLSERIESYPKAPKEHIKILNTKIDDVECYKVNYKVRSCYKTSVIYDELKRDGTLYLNTDTSPMKKSYADVIRKKEKAGEFSEGKAIVYDGEENELEISKMLKSYVPKIERKTISYRGNNNVLYTKTIVPKQKDVTLLNISRLVLPLNSMSFIVGNQVNAFHGVFHDGKAVSDSEIFFRSGISSETISEMAICDHCDSVVKQTGSGESYVCHECKKIICYKHSYYYGKWRLFNMPLCSDCAEQIEASKKLADKYTYMRNMPVLTLNFYALVIILVGLLALYYNYINL